MQLTRHENPGTNEHCDIYVYTGTNAWFGHELL